MKTNLGAELQSVVTTMKLLAAESQDKRGMKLLEELRLKIYQEMVAKLGEDPFLGVVPIPGIRCYPFSFPRLEVGLTAINHPSMDNTALIAIQPKEVLVPPDWNYVHFARLGERTVPFMSPCECCQNRDDMDKIAKFLIRSGFKRFTMEGNRDSDDGKEDKYRHHNLQFWELAECEWVLPPLA